jgi:chromosome partitioning protein
VKTVAFFNNKGGVGKTTLVYHLAHMMADRGETVLVVDLDPQANLTRMFLGEDRLEALWFSGEGTGTIFDALRPLVEGAGDVLTPQIEPLSRCLGLIVGDPTLSVVEDQLSYAWLASHRGDRHGLQLTSAFSRGVSAAATDCAATWVLIDVGPGLGAVNRAALIASDHVVIPVLPDLFSLKGLHILGPSLQRWRTAWIELLANHSDPLLHVPSRGVEPLGYVVMQHGTGEKSRVATAYQRWVDRFPAAYRVAVLDQSPSDAPSAGVDPYCLARLKHYRTLMPMAMEARKPVFALKPADGAIGAHGEAARNAYNDFLALARTIAERCGASLS